MAKDHCPHCQSKELTTTLTISGIHHARVDCANPFCQRFVEWLPKPDNERVRRPASQRDLVRKYSKGYCEICLILEPYIPKGEELEAQHIIEYQDGGTNDRENIQIVCTRCHRMIHWMRTYVVDHLIPGGKYAVVKDTVGS
jgi:5-methylcytosine-specific restriction endonuclease McrA